MLKLKVEFSPGDTIEFAAMASQRLAEKLDVVVCFDFNSVHCRVHPAGRPESLIENFHEALGNSRPVKVASND